MRNKKNPIFFDSGRRWKRIKIVSLGFLVVFFIFLSALFYANFTTSHDSKNKLSDLEVDQAIEEINRLERPVYNKGTFLTVEEVYGEEYVKRFGEDKKQVVLSFDDGPDPKYTEKILNIMRENEVHGTFYVVGSQFYKYPEIVRKIQNQGSDIGMHTFTHAENKDDAKLSDITFNKEFDFANKMFVHLFGYEPLLFRVPFVGVEEKLSYDALQYIGEAYKRGYVVSAPTVDSLDWIKGQTSENIVKLATTSDVMTVVILLHDSGGDRGATIEALPQIIKFYKDRGYSFVTTTQLAGQNGLLHSDVLSPHDKLVSAVTYYTYHISRELPRILQKGFLAGFIVVILHMGIVLCLATYQRAKSRREKRLRKNLNKKKFKGFISVIIPAYNEENSISSSIRSVLRSSFKNFELLVIDDGSTDLTMDRALMLTGDTRVKVFSKRNGGKCSALNYGVKKATGEIVVFIDADTRISTSALMQILQSFTNPRVGAVAGYIKVGNGNTFLSKLQGLEYMINQSIEKRVQQLFGNVMVVPGAFGAWRIDVIKRAGGFSKDTHTEDFDLTLSVLKRGYKVIFCESALAHTEAPHSLSQLFSQRFRWDFGNLQVFIKHKDVLFNKEHGALGLFLFPRFALIQVPTLLLTPLIDIYIILNLIVGERNLTVLFLLLYLVVQFILVFTAFMLSKNRNRGLKYMLFLRFPYMQIMYAVLFIAVMHALKGELVAWSKIQHTGKLSISKS